MSSWLKRSALFARTLTHLHPMQVAFRPVHVARTQALKRIRPLAAVVAGTPKASLGPPLLSLQGLLTSDLYGVDSELSRGYAALQGSAWLVGRDVALAPPHSDFTLASLPKLVRYQFNYLGAVRSLSVLARTEGPNQADCKRAASLPVAHLREFIERVPPGEGDAWEPYPVAIRILNVVLARELLRPVVSSEDARFLDEVVPGSLAQHARWLTASLELHLLGNHLYTDGAALFVAACAIDAPESRTWRTVGQAIIERSIATDVLADGGHSERSPMYAAIYLDQLLFVMSAARALGIPPPGGTARAAELLGRQLIETAHPDGEIPLLGDSALDEAPTPRDLVGALGAGGSLRHWLYGTHATTLESPVKDGARLFPETGVAAVRHKDSFLIVDGGPLGTFDQPGHAHSDALTYELSLRGQRIVSDAGAGHYDADAIRAYFRGPLAHSSVSVNGQGPDEVWGAFRAARRARVEPLVVSEVAGVHAIRGAVQSVWGWRHERLLLFVPECFLAVFDRVTGATGDVVSHVHFCTEVELQLEATQAMVRFGAVASRVERLVGAGWEIHEGEGAASEHLTPGLAEPRPTPSLRGKGLESSPSATLSGTAAAQRLPLTPFPQREGGRARLCEPGGIGALRGFTSLQMGEFEPSPELAISAVGTEAGFVAGYTHLFDAGVSVKSTGTGACIDWRERRIQVDFDRSGIRWELV